MSEVSPRKDPPQMSTGARLPRACKKSRSTSQSKGGKKSKSTSQSNGGKVKQEVKFSKETSRGTSTEIREKSREWKKSSVCSSIIKDFMPVQHYLDTLGSEVPKS